LIYRTLDYADPKGRFECKNDGYQFHLHALRPSSSMKSGKMGFLYDTGIHSLYQFGGEAEYVKQYWAEILITNQDDVTAEIYHYFNGPKTLATSPSKKMAKKGDSITVQRSQMRKPLKITRAGLCQFELEYGTINDGWARIAFNSDNVGYGNYSRPGGTAKQVAGDAKFCNVLPMKNGKNMTCSFPAW
jgi:hypothetical protein